MSQKKIENIKDTIKQKAPFKSVQQETIISLIRTTAQVKTFVESKLDIDDLSMQQYNVLRILRGANKAIPIMDISNRLVEPTKGITRLVNKLEQAGYVEKSQCKKDRRVYFIQVNQNGLELLKSLDHKITNIEQEIFKGMSEVKLKKLTVLLDELRFYM
jgi:DNA-binding MarR family transcriptional regulator